MPVKKSKIWQPKDTDEPIEFFGSDGDWTMWLRARTPDNGWYPFALQPPEKLRKTKSVYHGAWNGERLARGRDIAILAEFHSEILAELEGRCPKIDWEFNG